MQSVFSFPKRIMKLHSIRLKLFLYHMLELVKGFNFSDGWCAGGLDGFPCWLLEFYNFVEVRGLEFDKFFARSTLGGFYWLLLEGGTCKCGYFLQHGGFLGSILL